MLAMGEEIKFPQINFSVGCSGVDELYSAIKDSEVEIYKLKIRNNCFIMRS